MASVNTPIPGHILAAYAPTDCKVAQDLRGQIDGKDLITKCKLCNTGMPTIQCPHFYNDCGQWKLVPTDDPAPDYTELNEIPPGYYYSGSASCFFSLSTGQRVKDGEWADKWIKVKDKFPSSANEAAKRYPGIIPFYEHPGKLAASKAEPVLLAQMKPGDLAERITAQKEALDEPRMVERSTERSPRGDWSRVKWARFLDLIEEINQAGKLDDDDLQHYANGIIKLIDNDD